MNTNPYLLWNEMFKIYSDAINRKSPIKTKYEFLFNRLHIGFGNIITIVGRPGHGKTTLSDCILEDIEKQNKEIGVNIIDFQLEMPAHIVIRNMLVRNNINPEDIESIKQFYKKTENRKQYYRFYYKLGNIENFYNYSDSFFTEMKAINKDRINIVRFDHALMLRDRKNTIPLLLSMAVELKKKHNAIVIILSQLNRAINEMSRTKNGSDNNKVKDIDIYDTDALIQFSDIMISIDRPYLRGIREFTSKEIITTPDLTHISILKDRILDKQSEYLYSAKHNDYVFIEEIKDNKTENIKIIDNNKTTYKNEYDYENTELTQEEILDINTNDDAILDI